MHRALDILATLKAEGKIRATGASLQAANVPPDNPEVCRQFMDSGKVDVIGLVHSILRQRNRRRKRWRGI